MTTVGGFKVDFLSSEPSSFRNDPIWLHADIFQGGCWLNQLDSTLIWVCSSQKQKTVKLARLGGKDPDADEKLREGHGAWPCHECLVGAPISCTSWVEAVRSILGWGLFCNSISVETFLVFFWIIFQELYDMRLYIWFHIYICDYLTGQKFRDLRSQ